MEYRSGGTWGPHPGVDIFQSKGSINNTMYLGRFRRINKVEKCVEVIGTLTKSKLT